MPDWIRNMHQPEVLAFMREHFSSRDWAFTQPHGWGNETYFVRCEEQAYFVKLGAQAARVRVAAAIGLTPAVLADGCMADGTSIFVQPLIAGRKPSRSDYRLHLEQFAQAIQSLHHSPEMRQVLPQAASDRYSDAGREVLAGLRQRWAQHKNQAPQVARFIDESLDQLEQAVLAFEGAGLAASHNDICNANWLVSPEGKLYLIDLESMSMDDPALDIGATLWWYYPPALRPRFLSIAGYADDAGFAHRMQVRMAMHCLNILLPREHSFDEFYPERFVESLTDFRAALAGEENPQGYGD